MTKIYAKYSSEGNRLWWKWWNKLRNQPNKQRNHERFLNFYCSPKIGKYKTYNRIRQANLVQVLSKEEGVGRSKRCTFSHFRRRLEWSPNRSSFSACFSHSIQTYLWLCSSAKWLPEREKSWFIQIDIDSTTAKNIVYIQSP